MLDVLYGELLKVSLSSSARASTVTYLTTKCFALSQVHTVLTTVLYLTILYFRPLKHMLT